MEAVTGTSRGETGNELHCNPRSTETQHTPDTLNTSGSKKYPIGTFMCSFCSLTEVYDYKGIKPPFARQINYLEECYVMKDPFNLPNRGEVLVLGADCNVCNKPVCSDCSIFYGKRFCKKCASDNISNLPPQLHLKIENLNKNTQS